MNSYITVQYKFVCFARNTTTSITIGRRHVLLRQHFSEHFLWFTSCMWDHVFVLNNYYSDASMGKCSYCSLLVILSSVAMHNNSKKSLLQHFASLSNKSSIFVWQKKKHCTRQKIITWQNLTKCTSFQWLASLVLRK